MILRAVGKGTWAAALGLGALVVADQFSRASLARRSRILATSAGLVEVEVTGSGPDVLVLHGTYGGFDQGTWLAKALELRGHRVISISRPGYLGTPDRPSLDGAVELCVATLAALGAERAAVIGISGGGLTALALAKRHPERVNALVMLSAVSGFVTEVGWQLALYLARTGIDMNKAVLASLPGAKSRQLLVELTMSFLIPERRIPGAARDVAVMRSFEPQTDIRVPALVVHGTADHAVPFAHAQRSVSWCAAGELAGIVGGGHLACLTHAEVGERIRAFLSAPRS